MSLTLKLIIFFAILIMDAVGAFVVINNLKASGKENMIPVILSALGMSLVVVGVIFFVIME